MTGPRTQREIAGLEWQMARDEAERVACRGCEAGIGEHCRNPDTGDELNAPAHGVRIGDAAKGSGMTQSDWDEQWCRWWRRAVEQGRTPNQAVPIAWTRTREQYGERPGDAEGERA